MARSPNRQRGSQDLPESLRWARRLLPHYFSDDPARFHVEFLRDLESGRRLIARVAPRGHAKSTCAALAYPLWCLCHQRRRNIVIITQEASLSTQFVRDLRHELESNEPLIKRYGDLTRPGHDEPPTRNTRRKWSEAMFTTANGVTVQARSTGGSLRGCRVGPHRPDLIICDDLEKDEHVATPDGRRKLERWLRRVVMPALAPGGQLVLVGSILHYDSLLSNLRDPLRWPGWDYRVYRAKEARQDPDGRLYVSTLWPARWPLHKLDEERERIGTLAFEQEYQANPIDESVRIFRPEWLKRWEPADLAARADRLIYVIAVDPATGENLNDFFALWAGGFDPQTGVIYTHELTLERIDAPTQVQRVLDAFKRYPRVARIGIEATGYQRTLRQHCEDECRKRGLYLPLQDIDTRSGKVGRIQGASPFFENGTFLLPPTLDPEAESQFLHFPAGKHDDAPDVCAMALQLVRELRGAHLVQAQVVSSGRFNRPRRAER